MSCDPIDVPGGPLLDRWRIISMLSAARHATWALTPGAAREQGLYPALLRQGKPTDGCKQMAQLVPGTPIVLPNGGGRSPHFARLRHHRGAYEIVAGEGRWRAAQREIARPVPGTDRQPQDEPGYKVLKRSMLATADAVTVAVPVE